LGEMIQEHVGSFFIIVEEENPFVLFEEVVPRRGEIVDLPWIVLSQTDYLVLDCPLTSRTISGRIRNGPATRCSFSALGKNWRVLILVLRVNRTRTVSAR